MNARDLSSDPEHEAARGTPGRYNIQSVDRAIRTLGLLSDGRTWKLSEIGGTLGVSGSTAYRLLTTLESHQYVERDEVGGYRLGLACIELSRAYADASDLRRISQPELDRLRDETRETIHLGVLDRLEVVYLEKRHGLHAIGLMSSRIGGRSPAHCTGLGKVLLAFQDPENVRAQYQQLGLRVYTDQTISNLDDLMEHLNLIRRQGYAFDLGEHEPEVRCIAAPVFDSNGAVVAAISVSGPSSRLGQLSDQGQLVERTVDTAQMISRRLGYPSAGW